MLVTCWYFMADPWFALIALNGGAGELAAATAAADG